jgi:hypothetical protein
MRHLSASSVLLCVSLVVCGATTRADDNGASAHKAGSTESCEACGAHGGGFTVGPDPFRSGNQVVRDRDTGRPLYRIEPDPFHPGWQRVDDYSTGRPLREIRPDPFNSDQSVIDDP